MLIVCPILVKLKGTSFLCCDMYVVLASAPMEALYWVMDNMADEHFCVETILLMLICL